MNDHLIQGPRAIQGGEILNNVCDMKVSGVRRKWRLRYYYYYIVDRQRLTRDLNVNFWKLRC